MSMTVHILKVVLAIKILLIKNKRYLEQDISFFNPTPVHYYPRYYKVIT